MTSLLPGPALLRLRWGTLALLLLLALRAPAQLLSAAPVPALPRALIDLTAADWARSGNGRQSNFEYTVGADPQVRSAGFFGQRLRREMQQQGGLTAEIAASLNSYRRRKWLFLGERFLFVGAVATYGLMISASNSDHPWFESPQRNMIGVVAFSLITNIFVTRSTNLHMQRAVKAYQGGLVPQRPTGLRRFTAPLRPSFGGLAPQRAGGVALVLGWHL